ncbi:MAG: hypothetical protein LBQ33_04845 [Oscillospiraceae bacterium]|nr:hypothetical protein [Oscillospiraceae bacterium]
MTTALAKTTKTAKRHIPADSFTPSAPEEGSLMYALLQEMRAEAKKDASAQKSSLTLEVFLANLRRSGERR